MASHHRLIIALAAGASLSALVVASAAAAPADDAQRDARIAKLEAAVEALQGEVAQDQTLRQQNTELKQEVGDLQAQVSDLKASTVQQISDVRQSADNAPRVSLANGRPTFSTADGQFTAALRGQLQLDTAAYLQPDAGPIATDLRRDGPALGASATNVDLGSRPRPEGRHRLAPRPDRHRRHRLRRLGLSAAVRLRRLWASRTPASSTRRWAQYSGLKPVPPARRRLAAADRAGGPGLDQLPAVPRAAGDRGRRAQPRGRRHPHRRRRASPTTTTGSSRAT